MKIEAMLEQGWITEDMAKFLREGKEGVLSVVDGEKFVKVREGKAILGYLVEGVDMRGNLAVIYDPISDEVRRCTWDAEAPYEVKHTRIIAISEETQNELIEPYREAALDEIFRLTGAKQTDYPLDKKDCEISDAYFGGQSEYKAKLDNIVFYANGAFVAHYENIALIINEGAQAAGRRRARQWWTNLNPDKREYALESIRQEATREVAFAEIVANPPSQLACAKAIYDAIKNFCENGQVENLKVWGENGECVTLPVGDIEHSLIKDWDTGEVFRGGVWSKAIPADQVTGITWGRQVVYSREDEETPSA